MYKNPYHVEYNPCRKESDPDFLDLVAKHKTHPENETADTRRSVTEYALFHQPAGMTAEDLGGVYGVLFELMIPVYNRRQTNSGYVPLEEEFKHTGNIGDALQKLQDLNAEKKKLETKSDNLIYALLSLALTAGGGYGFYKLFFQTSRISTGFQETIQKIMSYLTEFPGVLILFAIIGLSILLTGNLIIGFLLPVVILAFFSVFPISGLLLKILAVISGLIALFFAICSVSFLWTAITQRNPSKEDRAFNASIDLEIQQLKNELTEYLNAMIKKIDVAKGFVKEKNLKFMEGMSSIVVVVDGSSRKPTDTQLADVLQCEQDYYKSALKKIPK